MNQPLNAAQKLIKAHLVEGEMIPGQEIAIQVDQTLTQDATGTMVMLELLALGLKNIKTELSVQYVDHNLLQTDHKNADDHAFLRSACKKFGLWYSRPGNGVSHQVHMERFGVPGKCLVGSDSHTSTAGGLGMLALGAGGLDVAYSMMGLPIYIKMPKVLGVKLTGRLPDWVSAKDVILEMLRRYDVKGCRGMIVEYYGPGVAHLSASDRGIIANMGTEMGATATVFPSDMNTLAYLKAQGREDAWQALTADKGAQYDQYEAIELSTIEPLIACPSSPGNVVTVREVAGKPISQSVIGSSANSGLRDFWMASAILKGRTTHPGVSLDMNPSSQQVIENLAASDAFLHLIQAGARFHQAGCMGCIGMGQAPASGKISLRTMPRNFPGRSGTKNDLVYLCSPETAAASALTGVITDPRDLKGLYDMEYPQYVYPEREHIHTQMLIAPENTDTDLVMEDYPNIKPLPEFTLLQDEYEVPVLLKLGDNISTDDIIPAGARALPFRSNIPAISHFLYDGIDNTFFGRAGDAKVRYGGHIVVAGENYAQGSSREHAAIATRHVGQVAVMAKSYARIGWQNLINFGILPLEFANPQDYDTMDGEDIILLTGVRAALKEGRPIMARNASKGKEYEMICKLSPRQIETILAGGAINYFKRTQ